MKICMKIRIRMLLRTMETTIFFFHFLLLVFVSCNAVTLYMVCLTRRSREMRMVILVLDVFRIGHQQHSTAHYQ